MSSKDSIFAVAAEPCQKWHGEGRTSSTDPLQALAALRFGMFIHWGLYSVPGGIWHGQEGEYIGEWLQARFRIPNAEYAKIAEEFRAENFNAREWVCLAREAGMRYLVFTAKHHDGFAMYDSEVSDFNVVRRTPFGRDPLAELAEACREEGLKLGLYYSQDLDWEHPDGGDPGPGFPKNYGMSWGNDWEYPNFQEKKFERYFEGKVIPQVEELLTRYGEIALIWFDCPVSIPFAFSERLVRRVKELQPNCLVNGRVGHHLGDYGSLGDNQTPATRRQGLWECPGTLNETWGYKHNDHDWKTPAEVITLLTSLASRDANYLLNIGPRPDGAFPSESVRILEQVSAWMRAYPGVIHATTGNPFPTDFDWGCLTVTAGQNYCGTRVNFILSPNTTGEIQLNGLQETVRRVFDPRDPSRCLPFRQSEAGLFISTQSEDAAVELAGLPRVLCAELQTTQAPRVDERLIPQNGALRLLASQAEILEGDGSAAPASVQINPDGALIRNEGRASLRDGLWMNGHLGGDALQWSAFIPEAGNYQAEILSIVEHHGSPWKDGQVVRISMESGAGKQTYEIQLRGAQIPSAGARHFPEGLSPAGCLTLHHPGEVKITLQVLTPTDGEQQVTGLKELILRKPEHEH